MSDVDLRDFLALDFFADTGDLRPSELWDQAELLKGLTPVFASPGGKWFAAAKFIKLFPPHATYVEPFCGSAAIFWKKDPAPIEVLNDLRQNLIDTFRYLRETEDFQPFLKLRWSPSRKIYDRLEKARPEGLMQSAYRYLYLAQSKFSNISSTGYNRKVADIRMHRPRLEKLKKWHARLRHVTLLQQDAHAVVRKYDSPTTFFYIDPPYPKARNMQLYKDHDYTMDDLGRLMAILKGCQGKFILSLNAGSLPKPIPAGMKVKRIFFPYPPIWSDKADGKGGRQGWQNHMEVFIHNFDLKSGRRFSAPPN